MRGGRNGQCKRCGGCRRAVNGLGERTFVSLSRAMERISAVVGRARPDRRERPFGFLSRRYERLNDLKGQYKASFPRENPKGLANQLVLALHEA